MSSEADGALLRSWQAGDHSARDILIGRHHAAVRRFFDVKATAAADDLTQRTFLVCLESVDRLERSESFRSFLLGIARNILLRYLCRKEQREEFADFEHAVAKRTGPSTLVARRQEQQVVLRALAELPDDTALLIQLAYWDELRVAEIADCMDISRSAVGSRLHRARQQLRGMAVQLAHRAELKARLNEDIDAVTRSITQGEAVASRRDVPP